MARVGYFNPGFFCQIKTCFLRSGISGCFWYELLFWPDGPQAVRREAVDTGPGTRSYRRACSEPAGMATPSTRGLIEHGEGNGGGDEAAREGPRGDPVSSYKAVRPINLHY